MTIARLRKDLIEAGFIPRILHNEGVFLWKDFDWKNSRFRVICLEDGNHWYNLCLSHEKTGLFLAQSIDFEFEEQI